MESIYTAAAAEIPVNLHIFTTRGSASTLVGGLEARNAMNGMMNDVYDPTFWICDIIIYSGFTIFFNAVEVQFSGR